MIIILLVSVFNSGCLVFNKISYEMILNDDGSGTANLYISDITSDATEDEAFSQDTSGLFSFMLNSNEFIEQMKNEGRLITSRKLVLNGYNLDAKVQFNFTNIVGIENIEYQDGFYFLTMGLEDSVIATNGEIIKSKNYKRILWDDKQRILKFTMFSAETDAYRKLAPYYKNQE